MNTYIKYCPNVFLAKCPEPHGKGEVIEVTTKYGKGNESIVFNLIYERDGFYFYSIVRADGFNVQERAKAKAERYAAWSAAAESKSDAYYERSQAAVAGIVPGQPILVGHHSEKRHRRDVERSWDAMGKSVEQSRKAEEHEGKAEYWARMASTINLSMPESIEYYEYELEKARAYHTLLKEKPELRSHGLSLTYAKKEVNEFTEKLELAKRLWS